MGRLFLILGILFLVWIAYRFLSNSWAARTRDVERREQNKQAQKHNEHQNEREYTHQQGKQEKIQQIKACAYCKTHIPEDDGIYEHERFFCSYQHLDAYLEHKQPKE